MTARTTTLGATKTPLGAVLLVALVLASIIGGPVPEASSATTDTAAEAAQMLYELNRSRWDPATAPGIPADGIPVPRPPLAWDGSLASAASFHANEMIEHGYVAHRSAVTGVWPNELARDHGYPLPGKFSDAANGIESIQAGAPGAAAAVRYLSTSIGHRHHLYGVGGYAEYNEAGIGRSQDGYMWVVMTAYRNDAPVYLTGFVYDDADGDGVLDRGEGLEGVEVRVENRATLTGPGGLYTLALRRGTHKVKVSGGGFEGRAVSVFKIDRYNVGAEFRSGERRGVVRAYELCAGREPTILGTDGNDVLYGTPGRDVIHGLGGDDVVYGLGGEDVLCGGTGRDEVRGGAGNDFVNGGGGVDVLEGGPGDDRIAGGFGGDALFGGDGRSDRLRGGIGVDSCRSGEYVRNCET